ncbi:hypothetical protein [Sulfobacillus harzensis]|uniref:Uncharacterized protein n=1 Tax=Sulfobacillus harzensis TaxID=2729629 RepID=A0A7Y0Q5F8_9FIRM|nr:hypothetical protein [Sulfobacillus harzensis]NMP24259.1 hypothetical protein [Sulfobacillus harzensis]
MRLTIDVTDEQLEHLKALQEDFAYQTAHDQAEYPNIYVLVDFKTVVVDPDYESDAVVHFCDPKADTYDIPLEDLPTHLEDCYPETLAAFRAEHPDFDWDSDDDVNELLGAFPHIYKIHNALRKVDVQTFLTRKSAEAHLTANRYHYHEKAFIDRRKVWRDPVMQSLILMLYHLPLEAGASA